MSGLKARSVAVVHVNALLNSPLFDRLRQCLPEQFADLEKQASDLGIDFGRDVDRVVLSPGGMAMSGYFDGKPVAARMAGEDAKQEDYRGASVYTRGNSSCIAQLGNLLLAGGSDDCRGLIDRALEPTPEGAQDEIYGDVFLRRDTSDYTGVGSDQLGALLAGLSNVTLRANVWDSIAVTLEGAPLQGRNVRDLADMAKGAIALAKSQLDDEDVEYKALAELAKVADNPDKLEINLALPAQDLFDKLHFPCPGRDGGM
jgi:hypothetical protein